VPEDTPKRPIKSAAIIGAGTMGGGIAMNFANAGIPVTVLEMKQEALDKGLCHGAQELREHHEEGPPDTGRSSTSALGLIKGTLSYDDIKDADIVIEAVFEEMGVKEKVFNKLDQVMKPGRPFLASNTSTLDLNKIGGLHQTAAGRDRHAFLQSGQRDEAAGNRARREDRQDVLATTIGIVEEDQRRPAWSRASATASSAIA